MMQASFRKYLKTIWPTLIWAAFVFLMLILHFPKFKRERVFPIPHADKLVHIFLFYVLAFFILHFLIRKRTQPSLHLLLAVCFVTLYGIALEYVQLYTGRDFDVWDMVADAVGAFGALAIIKNKPR
jgi:VanZ family protein